MSPKIIHVVLPQKCPQSVEERKKKKEQKLLNIQKEMTIRSSFLVWRNTWTEEPSGYSPFQFNHSVVSDSLWPHELQHSRPPCPSPTPRIDSNSCPWNWWCHPTVSSSVIPFSHLQSFQHQDLFQGVSSSHQVAKVLEFQLQHQSFQWIFRIDFFRLDWLNLLAVQGTLKSFLQ